MKQLSQSDWSLLFANVVDHFDVSLYAFLAPILAPLFFPHCDPVAQLIAVYSTFGASSVLRVVSALYFGKKARINPAHCLVYSILGLTVSTLLIGCLPVHCHVGWCAGALLFVLRLLRTVFAAGESTVAQMYIIENKERNSALAASQYYKSASMLGYIVASGCASIVAYYPTLWRLPFLLAGVAGFVVWYQRKNSMVVSSVPIEQRGMNYQLLWHYKVDIVRIALVTGFSYLTYMVPFALLVAFVPLVNPMITMQEMMAASMPLLIIDTLAIPIVGKLVRGYNTFLVMVTSAVGVALALFPLFYLLSTASLWTIIMARLAIIMLGIIYLCPLSWWYSKQCLDENKYLVVGAGTALGSALGRGITPACLLLWRMTKTWYVLPFFLLIFVVAAIFSLVVARQLAVVKDQKLVPLAYQDQ
jgi:MFS family permease